MFRPIKVIDVELSRPLSDVENLTGYQTLKALVRLNGSPLGYVEVPLGDGRCTATVLSTTILDHLSWSILSHLLSNGLTTMQQPGRLRLVDLFELSPPALPDPLPLVTVAVCTRDRTANLALCLDSLRNLDYPALDIVIVDNAPSNNTTESLVRNSYPEMRYVREPRPGLNWARNRAILEARGDIIAYTDDDVVVDAGWVKALARILVEHPDVMVVTGLVVPYELETEPQVLFEQYGGFGRGFERRWYYVDHELGEPVAKSHGWAGKFGTGANMAYRRSLFDHIDHFDVALDVGTVTNGGGDIEMFFRVLREGCTLVYEPDAIVYHHHRRDYASFRKQIANNGVGFSAYLVRTAMVYPDERIAILRFWLSWLYRWHLMRLINSFLGRESFPRELIEAELWGLLVGLSRYTRSRWQAAKMIKTFNCLPSITYSRSS